MLPLLLLLLSVRLFGTPSPTSRAWGSQGWSVMLITCSYASEGPPFDAGQTSQSSQGLAMMPMSNTDRLLPHDAVSCSQFANLSQPSPSREHAKDFQLWLLCANRQLRQIVPMYKQLLELQCDGLVTNRAEAYDELGDRRYASDMAFVALVRRSLLDESTRSVGQDEVGQKGAVTLEELDPSIIPSGAVTSAELDTSTIPSITSREL